MYASYMHPSGPPSPSTSRNRSSQRHPQYGAAFPTMEFDVEAATRQIRDARRTRAMSGFGLPPERATSPFRSSATPIVTVRQVPVDRANSPLEAREGVAFPPPSFNLPAEQAAPPSQPEDPAEDFLFGKHLAPMFEEPEDESASSAGPPASHNDSLPSPGLRTETYVDDRAGEHTSPFNAPARSPTGSFTISPFSLFPGQSSTAFVEGHNINPSQFGLRNERRPSFSSNHAASSGFHQSRFANQSSFVGGSSSSYHAQSSFSSSQPSSPKGYDSYSPLSFMANQMPSLGLWRYLQDPSAQSRNVGYNIRAIPRGLQVIFGLNCHCSQHAQNAPRSTTSGDGGSSAVEQGRSSYGAQSLEGVWKLVNFMDGQSTSTPVESFKQFPKGFLFSISPPGSKAPDPPLQRKFRGTGAITNELADTPCASLGVAGLLGELNRVLGTCYELEEDISALLRGYVKDGSMDFGRAYGELRRGWFCDVGNLKSRLESGKRQDEEIRQKAIDRKRGLIVNPRIPPRRVWDLYSNRVLPFWVLLSTDVPRNLWAVSHAWVELKQRLLVKTRINCSDWPVPIPDDVDLEQVRVELLNLGAEYVWLDVLCLRQKIRGDGESESPLSAQETRLEQLREEEWKLDVPTIGHVYRCKPSQVVITYFSGLGRPFSVCNTTLEEPRAWLNRVWTMQETTPNWLLGGLTLQPFDDRDQTISDVLSKFHTRMCGLLSSLSSEIPDILALVTYLLSRKGTHDIDFIGALGYLLKCPAIPIYDEDQSVEDAWDLLLQQLHPKHLTDLLVMYPDAGQGEQRKWRPSWRQLKEFCPPRTLPVSYSQRDLLQCIPQISSSRGPAYSNYAYVIPQCFLVNMSEGQVAMHVPIGRLGAKGRPSENFRVEPLGHRYDSFEGYSAVGVADLEYWVLGKILERGDSEMTFEKVAVFRIQDPRERERLWHLNPGYSDTKISYV